MTLIWRVTPGHPPRSNKKVHNVDDSVIGTVSRTKQNKAAAKKFSKSTNIDNSSDHEQSSRPTKTNNNNNKPPMPPIILPPTPKQKQNLPLHMNAATRKKVEALREDLYLNSKLIHALNKLDVIQDSQEAILHFTAAHNMKQLPQPLTNLPRFLQQFMEKGLLSPELLEMVE